MDLTDYGRGLSGQGAADYSSAAWRAGDAERQRLESIAAQRSVTSSSASSNTAFDNRPGFFSSVLRIGFFLVVCFACAISVFEVLPQFKSFITNNLNQYFGSGAIDNALAISTGILVVVGVFFRNILNIINFLLVIILLGLAAASA